MKVLKIEQNTDEWLEFRKGKSGGSAFKDLYNPNYPTKSDILSELEKVQPITPEIRKMKVRELAKLLDVHQLVELKLAEPRKVQFYKMIAERVAKPITASDYADELDGRTFSMMVRGHILEPKALKAFEEKTGKTLDEDSVVWVSDKDENIYISPDGAITDTDGKVKEAVEVKCPDSYKVVKAYVDTEAFLVDYLPQIYKYFIVNEDLETLYLVVFTDTIPGLELQTFPIHREDIQDVIEEAQYYEQMVMTEVDRITDKIKELSF